MNIFYKSLLAISTAAAFFILPSCGGGGGGSDENFIAPAGMDHVIIRLTSGVTFEFLSDNGSNGGFPEQGTIRYEKNGADPTTFTDNIGNTLTLSWPEQFSFARYEYRRIGSQSGQIKFFGASSGVTDGAAGDALGGIQNDGTSLPAIFNILFNTSGTGHITSATIVMQIPIATIYYNGEFAASLSKSEGGPVEEGYDPYNPDPGPQPSEFTSAIFGAASGDNNKTLFMTFDDGNILVDDPELILTFNSDPILPDPDEEITDHGTGQATKLNTATPPADNSELYEFTYNLRQPLDTDDVIMALDYAPSGFHTALGLGIGVDKPTYTLTFTSDEDGTFVGSDGSSGTFSVF